MKHFIKWLAKVFKVDIAREVIVIQEVVKYKTLDENGIMKGDLIIHGDVVVEGTLTVYGNLLSTKAITAGSNGQGKIISTLKYNSNGTC